MENKDNEKKLKRPPVMQALYAAPARPVSDDPAPKKRRELRESETLCVYAGPEFFQRRTFNGRADSVSDPNDEPDYPENYDEPEETAEENAPDAPDPDEETEEERQRKLIEEALNGPQLMGLVMAPNTPNMNGMGMGMYVKDPPDASEAKDENLPTTTPKFCFNCGEKTVEGAIFCHRCGTKLVRN